MVEVPSIQVLAPVQVGELNMLTARMENTSLMSMYTKKDALFRETVVSLGASSSS